jgi:hypothetical protein
LANRVGKSLVDRHGTDVQIESVRDAALKLFLNLPVENFVCDSALTVLTLTPSSILEKVCHAFRNRIDQRIGLCIVAVVQIILPEGRIPDVVRPPPASGN